MPPLPTNRLILSAALASGAATLIYELVWTRALMISVGAMFSAITVVLSSFMLGLGLGALLGGRLAERPGLHPLRAYAAVEGLVALVGLGFPLVHLLVGSVEVPDLGPFPGRALLAGICLLPATTLMGTTFPLLSSALHRADADAKHLPSLYGANTLGAALGTVLGGLLLPFWFGVAGALVLPLLLNLLAAGLALRASRGPLPRAQVSVQAPALPLAPGLAALLLWSAAGSGALVMLAELFWTRSFLLLDSTVWQGLVFEASDAMTLVLALVLAGNGLGGLLASRLAGWSTPELARAVGLSWLLVACLTPLGLEWFTIAPLPPGGEPGTGVLLARLLAMVPPAVLMGLGFPLLARLYAGALQGHGPRLARIWWVNSLASVLGAALGGWVLVPRLGVDRGLLLVAALALALGLGALLWAGLRRREGAMLTATAVLLGGVLVLVPRGPGLAWERLFGPGAVLATWEGWSSTSVVVQAPAHRLLISNGRSIMARPELERGGTNLGRRVEGAQRILLVGYGTGLLARGLWDGAQPEELVIVELDRAQFEAADWFGAGDLLEQPGVRIVVDDAMHYLAVAERPFDLIVVDAWGPDASPAIYSTEFHELAASRLNPEGMFWAKLNPLAADSLQAVVDAARCTWPRAWTIGQQQPEALLGSRQEVAWDGAWSLPPADEACDPLSQLYPRRLRALSVELELPPPEIEPPPPPDAADGPEIDHRAHSPRSRRERAAQP